MYKRNIGESIPVEKEKTFTEGVENAKEESDKEKSYNPLRSW